MHYMKKIIVDLDNTISFNLSGKYSHATPNKKLIEKLYEYKLNGFYIVIFTARNMRTYKENIGKINIHTLPVIIDWLNENRVPYDEVIVGKPWCGDEGFYVDDRAIRPSELCNMTLEEISNMLEQEKKSF